MTLEQQSSTSDAAAVVERIEAVSPLIASHALAAEEHGRLDDEVVAALDDAGVFRIGVATEYGGLGLGARDQLDVLAAIASADGSAAWVAMCGSVNVSNFGLCFPKGGADELFAQDWTGPRLAGSTFGAGKSNGTAEQVDGGWLVSGQWGFCSAIHHSAWLAAGVDAVKKDGTIDRACVLLPREELDVVDDWHVMGLAASGSNTAMAKGAVFVPEDRLVPTSEVLAAYADDGTRYGGLLFRIDRLAALGVEIAGIALGLARGALASFCDQAANRKPFGLPYESMGKTAAVQVVAAKCEAMINIADAALHELADEVDRRGRENISFSPEERLRNDTQATLAARMCLEAIDTLQVTLGSPTAALSNPLQKFARDARAVNLHGLFRFETWAESRGRVLMGEPVHKLAWE